MRGSVAEVWAGEAVVARAEPTGESAESLLASLALCAGAALTAFAVPMLVSIALSGPPPLVVGEESTVSMQSVGRPVSVRPPNPAHVAPRLRLQQPGQADEVCVDPHAWR